VEIGKARRQGGAAGASPLGDGYVEVRDELDGVHEVCVGLENGDDGAKEDVDNELKSAREEISKMAHEAEKVSKVDLKP
jgi:hypothetical protein